MPTTIASASVLEDGRLAILVEAGEARSLHSYLRSKGVRCSEVRPVIWRPRRITRDATGKLNFEEDVLECEIVAEGTLNDSWNWISDWAMAKLVR
jgi:hypothetical protein